MFRTPVAYIVFNRPWHTRRTFAAIRAYRPSKLFIIADGPRDDHPEDIGLCREVRNIVAEIDWPCEVRRNYAERNLGCGRRVSSGLDWVFSFVDGAIILEDDCLASPDFFPFCDVLLDRYKDDERVWVVSGNSYQPQFRRGDGSYYFSKYPDIWGWATWRRCWKNYQHDLPFLSEWKFSGRWKECFPKRSEQHHFLSVFQRALTGAVDTWDYQWVGCVIYAGGLSATPNANLVQNIGFDSEAAKTTERAKGWQYSLCTLGPIIHPSQVAVNEEADEYHRLVIRPQSHHRLLVRIFRRIERSFRRRRAERA